MNEPNPSPRVWVDHRLAVRPSSIEGHGLFAIESTPAETIVIRLGGELVDSERLVALLESAVPIGTADTSTRSPSSRTLTL